MSQENRKKWNDLPIPHHPSQYVQITGRYTPYVGYRIPRDVNRGKGSGFGQANES